MISKVLSSAVMGVDGYIVVVEVDISSGLPQFTKGRSPLFSIL